MNPLLDWMEHRLGWIPDRGVLFRNTGQIPPFIWGGSDGFTDHYGQPLLPFTALTFPC